MSAEGFEEVRGRCAEGTERAGVPRPGRGRGGGGRPRLLLLTGVAGLLGRHDYRGYGASVSLTGATVATHPTTSRDRAGPPGSDWTAPDASSMLLGAVHAFQRPLDFSELRFLGSDVRQRKLNPRRQRSPSLARGSGPENYKGVGCRSKIGFLVGLAPYQSRPKVCPARLHRCTGRREL